MNLYDYLKPEDLNDGLAIIYDFLGMDGVIRFIKEYQDSMLYIPSLKKILRNAVKRSMLERIVNQKPIYLMDYQEFLGCSYRTLQKILSEVVNENEAIKRKYKDLKELLKRRCK